MNPRVVADPRLPAGFPPVKGRAGEAIVPAAARLRPAVRIDLEFGPDHPANQQVIVDLGGMSGEDLAERLSSDSFAAFTRAIAVQVLTRLEAGYMVAEDPEPIHNWFELSYSSYLVLPRSVLQSAPAWWQRAFVWLLRRLEEWFEMPVSTYKVQAQGGRGRFTMDPLADYDRGRRIIPRKAVSAPAPPSPRPSCQGGEAPPCCARANEYNGFASGPTIFQCPKGCSCHD